ncbi:MAG: hypothetical protein ACRDF5_03360 [bacterium]
MNQRVIVGMLLVLALAVGGVALARSSYQAGFARGVTDSSPVSPPAQGDPGPRPYPYYGPPYAHGPWGFGFGFFGFLVPLLFFFLIFTLLRGMFWRGGPHGYWGKGVPPTFEEWHRRAHESKGGSPPGVTA